MEYMAFLFQSQHFHCEVGPQLSKPTPPTGRRPSLELEERNEGGELAIAQTLLSDGTRVDSIGVLSTRTSFFEGKISRMSSSTTSWVRVTYSCHHFRSPFRTTATLHSNYFFHAFILLYVLLGYFHVLPFADMWDIEHLGRSSCTTWSICRGTLHFRPHELHANPRRRINK